MIKKYKIGYCGELDKPLIKINNNFLKGFNFNVDDEILINYNEDKIIIERVKNDS